MATSPPESPASLVFSSPNYCTSQSSAGVFTPSNRASLRYSRHCKYAVADDDDDSDEDLENIDPRADPSTPKANIKRSKRNQSLTPSKFTIKGTVTPSRAAPLFARFTSNKRNASRPSMEDLSDEDGCEASDEENDFFFSKTIKVSTEENQNFQTSKLNTRNAVFLNPDLTNCEIPRRAIPISNPFRHRLATENVASYLSAVRSNSLSTMPWASSARGTLGGSIGRGVLGVSRMLGAGDGLPSVSQRAFHLCYETESISGKDLFTLPSTEASNSIAHPLCAEYAFSSRNLNNHQAQWLAVGDNEGSVHLINTLNDPMASFDTSTLDKPTWQTCVGSVFELKWRFDDEMIATGGSDYTVQVWSAESGSRVRAFKGHRGSPRSIAWDPNGSGNTLVSGGRDGAIHLYDLRVRDSSRDGDIWSPCLSLWEAHTSEELPRPVKGPGSRGGTKSITQERQPKGVTSLAFLAGRGSNLLASAGCADGRVKLWDLRSIESESVATGSKNLSGHRRRRVKGEDISFADPLDQGIDVTRQSQTNRSSHGISNIIVGGDKLFAACTDGRIYTINCSDFLQSSFTATGFPIAPLYHDLQRGNTLYARMALHDDERTLALGCNTGVVTVWDTHAASLALSEVYSDTIDYSGEGEPEEQWLDPICSMARPAILRGGHSENFEVNCVSWAHGPQGPTLASVSDDYTIRTWHPSPREEAIVRRTF